MKVLIAKPLIPHSCQQEIQDDPRSKELGSGSIVQCSCNRRYECKTDYRGERFWDDRGHNIRW